MDEQVLEFWRNTDLYLDMEVTLNRRGYGIEEVDFFIWETFLDRDNVTVIMRSYPAAVGDDFTIIQLIFVTTLSQIAADTIQKLGKIIFKWVKNKLRRILKDKNSFDGSHVVFKFQDVTISILVNSKEELYDALEHFSEIVNFRKKEIAESDSEAGLPDNLSVENPIENVED